MSKQKKISKKKLKTSYGGRRKPDRSNFDRVKKKAIILAIAVILILAGFIWYFAKNEDRTPLQSSELETGARQESENTAYLTSALNFTEAQYDIEMIYVRGGTFMMGCGPEQEEDCFEYEEAPRRITLSDYYIGKYEVTQAQWQSVMGDNPSNFKREYLPVENVSWDDVQEFVNKLNAATGRTYRLPTEAEWEYAARGGGQSKKYKYSGSNDVGDVAWYENNSEDTTHPVGTKNANELGIHDMSGNVWEWVSDWYGEFGVGPQKNPKGPGEGSFRVIRGGGWGSYARSARVSNFYSNEPDKRHKILGFRLACDFK